MASFAAMQEVSGPVIAIALVLAAKEAMRGLSPLSMCSCTASTTTMASSTTCLLYTSFAFLILVALYEKWSLPLAVFLTVPIAVLGAYRCV